MPSNPDTELRRLLLKTKISVPPLPGEFVHRPRLTDRINQGVNGPADASRCARWLWEDQPSD